jgi:hypothetical protein
MRNSAQEEKHSCLPEFSRAGPSLLGIGATGIATVSGIAPAAALPPLASLGAGFIGAVLAKAFEEVAANRLVKWLAPSFQKTEQEMRSAGYPPHWARGWQYGSDYYPSRLITMTSVDDCCVGIVTERSDGCTGAVTLRPPELQILHACLHGRIGLPGYWSRCGYRFTPLDRVDFCLPVVVHQRAGGPCGMVTVMETAAGHVITMETGGNYACVTICIAGTTAHLVNRRLPLSASAQRAANSWEYYSV